MRPSSILTCVPLDDRCSVPGACLEYVARFTPLLPGMLEIVDLDPEDWLAPLQFEAVDLGLCSDPSSSTKKTVWLGPGYSSTSTTPPTQAPG
jgi:hypothetical protein